MLKKFEVRNYANFKGSISIDFSKVGGYHFSTDCVSNQMISKMLVYGKNASGKTNLGKAITNIRDTLIGQSNQQAVFLNADSSEKYAEFRYVFQFDNDEVEYIYKKKDATYLIYEELNINQKNLFKNSFFDVGIALECGNQIEALGANRDRYVEAFYESVNISTGQQNALPFLRWLVNNSLLSEDSLILKLYNHVRGMHMFSLQTYTAFGMKQSYGEFFKIIYQEGRLQDFEDFLNAMGVECKLEFRKLPDDSIQLYFKHERLIPFLETASSGTIALLSIYRRFYDLRNASFLYIDEFDAFYHYEMSEKMISYLKQKYPTCQVILTTHNTNLMTNKIMRPDCLFILSAFGTLTPLCAATERELREGHNLEKMYISGEFADYE